MGAPEATFFVFLFHLFIISPFYHKCNQSPLETIKGEAGATPQEDEDTTKKHKDASHTPR
jgi:hypothetical protein